MAEKYKTIVEDFSKTVIFYEDRLKSFKVKLDYETRPIASKKFKFTHMSKLAVWGTHIAITFAVCDHDVKNPLMF